MQTVAHSHMSMGESVIGYRLDLPSPWYRKRVGAYLKVFIRLNSYPPFSVQITQVKSYKFGDRYRNLRFQLNKTRGRLFDSNSVETSCPMQKNKNLKLNQVNLKIEIVTYRL